VSDIGRIWADAAQGNSETATTNAVSKVRMVEPEKNKLKKTARGKPAGRPSPNP
jgi:hypothetical protein